jgi:hypothetical protein
MLSKKLQWLKELPLDSFFEKKEYDRNKKECSDTGYRLFYHRISVNIQQGQDDYNGQAT